MQSPKTPFMEYFGEDDMFKSLLTSLQIQSQQNPFSFIRPIEIIHDDHFLLEQMEPESCPNKKNNSEWVWEDPADEEIEELYQMEDITAQDLKLKKVQSSRKEQEDKLSHFLRINNLIKGEDDQQYTKSIKSTLNLSPRKKKKIDKDKQKDKQRNWYSTTRSLRLIN